MSKFWKETIPEGYYDISTQVGTKNGRSIQTNWHHITFTRVKVNIKKNDRILDFACGSGNFFASIDNLNEESIGLDISDKQIKYANTWRSSKVNPNIIKYLERKIIRQAGLLANAGS